MKTTRLTLFCLIAALCAAAPAFAGLIAHYAIQADDSPLVIEDLSGSGRDAAFVDTQDPPAPVYVEGYPCAENGALRFNGTTQHVDASGRFGNGIYLNSAVTVAMWVKGPAQNDMRVFSEGSTASNNPLVTIGTRSPTDGTVKLYIRGSTTVERFSTRVAFDNTWHHIAWVDKRVGAGANMLAQSFVYIDGVLDSAFTYVRPLFTGTNALNTMTIGAIRRATISNRFTGVIDDVRIYDHALSPEEVSALVVPPCAGCAVQGDPDYYDTEITGVTIGGPAGNAAGWYRILATAADGTGDPIWYTIVASNPAWSEVWAAAGTTGALQALLRPGAWTITVTADDHPLCKDGAVSVQTITVTDKPMLVAHFPFDGGVADASGNGNHGTFMGGAPNYVEGFDGTPGGALQLDGVDDYVNVTQVRGLPLCLSNDLTVAFWVKGLKQSDRRMFSEGMSTNTTPLYNVGTHNTGANGKADIFIRSLGASYGHAYSDREVLDGQWHHVAWVDGNGAAVLYIDGIRDAAALSYDRGLIGPMSMDRTAIGAVLRATASNFLAGALDDVRLYNYALSPEEVLALIPEPDDCPVEGDTHCLGLSYVGPEGGVEGVYTFTCDAVDDSGDPMFYVFVLRDESMEFVRQIGPQAEPSADFNLTPGTWIVEVEVDDSIWCRDRAADAGCSVTVVVRTEPPFLVTHLDMNGDLADGAVGGNHGAAIKAVAAGGTWEVVEVEPDFNEGFDCASPGAVEFFGDAAPGMVRLAHANHMPIVSKSSFTVAAWVRGLPQADRRVFALSSSTNIQGLFTLGTHNAGADGTLDFFLRDDAGTALKDHAHSAGIVFDGTWHHFAWADNNGRVVLYIDGRPDATDFSYARPAVFAPDTTTLGGIIRLSRLASDPPANPMTSFFDGMIDDVRLYNYALSPAEAADLAAMRPDHCCPERGDTHCTGIEVAGGPLAGLFTVTATGYDDSRDAVLYVFKADNGAGTVLEPVSQTGNVAVFDLTPGTWTISALADDDPECGDVASDAVCTAEVIVLRCPIEGDTHCLGLAVEGGPGEGPYTVTCTASDDSGDPILYAFTAEDESGTVLEPVSQDDNIAVFDLTEGVWTITVIVDDDPTCDDQAEDAVCTVQVIVVTAGTKFKRGDANADGKIDIADAVCVLGYLFGPPSDSCKQKVRDCADAADANDDGKVDIADAVKVLGHLFGGAGALPDPFAECGTDPTEDDLGCESFAPCKN
ncbi:MAG TPA: hypothetical protein PKX48_05310 [Planctomycetota bacterium]|jgi:hypothetical protein|nr:hypothetical protein [Planctomycetota bacterium]NMD34388.1 hypothetical protein [Planctomycetota bacterium]HNR99925.1 hypothetical protein [Planctomycetota bacterium]HNU24845.1 hypothetical protein [Planctomycetota bacterium]HOE29447.1 hypothetical protein [Planctomycetota bacterium]